VASTTIPKLSPIITLLWLSTSSSFGIVGVICYVGSDWLPNPDHLLAIGQWFIAIGGVGIFAVLKLWLWVWFANSQ
jgi:hypothetical protein